MDSRLSEVYNKRAALLRMIPGGYSGVIVNTNEGGEPNVTVTAKGTIKKLPDTRMNLVLPTGRELGLIREKVVDRYKNNPLEVSTTFTGVLGASDLNTQFTKIHKSAIPVENFDVIGSERYPEHPVLWQTSIGATARLFGRSDAIKYSR